MDNEVVIHVRADDDTKSGFDSAKRMTTAFVKDISSGMVKTGDLGNQFAKDMGKGFAAAGDMLAPILGTAAAAASPLIGTVIAGGIIGGVGAGGIIGAVMVASKDPRVQTAAKDMSGRIQAELKTAAEPFIATTLSGLRQMEGAVDSIDFGKIFRNASRDAEPIVKGVRRAIESIGDAIEMLSDSAGPVMEEIGSGIGEIGDALGEGLASLSDNGEDAADGLKVMFDIVEMGVDSTFRLIDAMTELWDLWKKFTFVDEISSLISDYGDESGIAAKMQGDLRDATRGTTKAVESQKSALEELADEYRAQMDPAFGLLDAMDDMKDAQRDYNDAVKEHGKRSPQAQEALRRMAKEASKVADAAGEAGGAMNGVMSPAMEKMLRKAGFSTGQIRALKDQLRLAKGAADDWEGTFTQKYVVKYSYQGRLSPVGGGHENSPSLGADRASGGIVGAAASGGMRHGLTWVGEQGPELLDLPPGARVTSNPDSMRGNTGGAGPLEITIRVAKDADQGLMQEIVRGLRFEVRAQGGNTQQVLGTV